MSRDWSLTDAKAFFLLWMSPAQKWLLKTLLKLNLLSQHYMQILQVICNLWFLKKRNTCTLSILPDCLIPPGCSAYKKLWEPSKNPLIWGVWSASFARISASLHAYIPRIFVRAR